jgi:hypothetical protein
MLAVIAAAAAIGSVVDAHAGVPPTLSAVSSSNRHPTATFSAPGAEFASVYMATKPDRASNGEFLRENVALLHPLTAEEVQRGTWLEADQVDPGTYYVLLQAFDYECFASPATCTEGSSAMVTLTVPTPKQRFTPTVDVRRYSRYVSLRLEVRPLAGNLPYQVCWRNRQRARRCAKGVLRGFSWNTPASHDLEVGLRGLARTTTFTWQVRGKTVASKTVGTVPG